MSEFPDEEVPRRLDAVEAALATGEHRWYARATLLAALATGVTLLLPWTFSRRLGLSVWQLGIEVQPTLALTWLAGLLTSVVALVLKPGHKARAAAAITGIIAVAYLAGAWQASRLEAVADTWPGPGPAFAITTSLSWLLTAAAQLVARHDSPATHDPAALARAVSELRRTRL
jgi:hypothetical protein